MSVMNAVIWIASYLSSIVHHQPNLQLKTINYQSSLPVMNSTTKALASLATLQQWYNTSSGLWDTTGWWNSANCLTVLADFAALDPAVATAATDVFANTLTRAQKQSLQMTKSVHNFMITSYYEDHWPFRPPGSDKIASVKAEGFLNDYYDDEGWWALAWIQVYDVTHDAECLLVAAQIFEDMEKGWSTPCGGIWWDKKKSYISAISNELFLSVASHLAGRMADRFYYLNWAHLQWAWFEHSGMINSKNLVNDGLDSNNCSNNGGIVWSYNQGVILGALVELANVSGNDTYILKAKSIASAAIAELADANAILHDPCEPHCGADGSQFKGVFLRNLQILQKAAPKEEYSTFITVNAESIWANDRDNQDKLSLDWSGPFLAPANASTQSSALDALVAAVAICANCTSTQSAVLRMYSTNAQIAIGDPAAFDSAGPTTSSRAIFSVTTMTFSDETMVAKLPILTFSSLKEPMAICGLEEQCLLLNGKHEDGIEKATIGDLGEFPVELQAVMFSHLDLQGLTAMRSVSKYSRAIVTAHPLYKTILKHAANVLRAILSVRIGQ